MCTFQLWLIDRHLKRNVLAINFKKKFLVYSYLYKYTCALEQKMVSYLKTELQFFKILFMTDVDIIWCPNFV
jgi:hypothetical protein